MWIWSVRTIFPTLAPAIGINLSLSPSQQDTLVGIFNLSTGAAFYVFGHVADRVGRKPTILIGFIASVVSILIFSSVSEYADLLALGACSGFFLGAYLPGATTILTDYYPQHRRGLVLGVHETGASIGQFLGAFLVSIGVVYFLWRYLLGGWALVGLIPFVLFLVVAPSKSSSSSRVERQTGGRTQKKKRSSISKFQILSFILVYTGVLAGVTGFVSVVPVYLVAGFGVTVSFVALLVGLSRVPAPVAQLISGRLSDRYGRKPILIVITCAVAICTAVMSFSSFDDLFIAALFIQFFFGAAFFPVVLAGISDVTSMEDRSSMIGVGMSAGGIIGSGGVPVVVGALAASLGYQAAFLFPLFLTISGAVATFGLKFVRAQDGLGGN